MSSSRANALEVRDLFFILIIYFLLCNPLSQIYLKNSTFFYKNWNLLFYITTLTILFVTKKTNISKIRLSKFDKNFFYSGLFLALIPIMFVFLLDILIVKTGIAKNNLFNGAELRNLDNYSSLDFFIEGLLSPLITQLFVTGYTLNVLLRRNDLIVIPLNGILFSLINFDLGVGYLILGMISGGLLKITGSLLPAIFLNIGCSLAKILIMTTYPRISTFLVFLV